MSGDLTILLTLPNKNHSFRTYFTVNLFLKNKNPLSGRNLKCIYYQNSFDTVEDILYNSSVVVF